MIPYFNIQKIPGASIGASASCCIMECGHRGAYIELNLIFWSMHLGIELS